MKEPMLTLVENAIGASFGSSADCIPTAEFNSCVRVAALAALMALRTPTEAMLLAGSYHGDKSEGDGPNWRTDLWQDMIDSAMQGG
jgi:hypothetical protein